MKIRTAEELMRDNLLVKHLAGSHAYGTALPTSDVDFRGIFCAEQINVRTPFFPVRECEDKDEEDTKYYELAHFVKLCLDCNPNIIETLWVDQDDVIITSAAYALLRSNRSRLLSSKVAFTFSGYALSQLKRIKGHHKWINNPQRREAPTSHEFLSVVQYFDQPFTWFLFRGVQSGVERAQKIDLSSFRDNYQLIPYGNDLYGVYRARGYQLWNDQGSLNFAFDGERHKMGTPRMIVKFNKDEYRLAKERHEQYWTWKNNRNKVRSQLEEQFGYDSKHASHLVRLLRMGEEILTTGQVHVKRPDATELLEIRNGKWSYDELIRYAEAKDKKIREQLYNSTPLPKKPDIKFAAELLMEIQDLMWSRNRRLEDVKGQNITTKQPSD